MDDQEIRLRQEISQKIKEIFDWRKSQKKFIPGKTWVQYAGQVTDDLEVNASLKTLIDNWFGLGPKSEEMELSLAKFLGVKGSLLTNSGSSANFLSIAALSSKLFPHHLNPGDEVITSACGFPTTVNPIVQHGLVPVFLDPNPETYNFEASDLEKGLSPKTRAVMFAHTQGNPNEMDKIVAFCKDHDLFLIEDNCDSLGSEYDGKKTGSFGILSTQSFYPPHHITMGEGGAINYNYDAAERIIRSLRDWGRACWCRGDEKRTLGACGIRFSYKLDGKPYDHKYIFNQLGYNLKPIEPQAAMGVEQLKKMPGFMEIREDNYERLNKYAQSWGEYFILPRSLLLAKPCWFAFMLTLKDGIKFTRQDLILFLEERMIQTRPLYSGNLTKQPAYAKVNYRQIGNLKNATRILHNTFFVGIYQGLGFQEIDYIAESIDEFLKKYR